MNNQIYKKFMHMVRQTHMTRTEKSRVLHAILGPIHSGQENKNPNFVKSPIASPFNVFTIRSWVHSHRLFTSALTAIVIIVLGGGGVVSASEKTLPGDTLYSVKVDIVEPVRLALNTNPESKAIAHSDLVNRRLEEAEILALRKELDQEKLDVIVSLIDEHSNNFDKNVTKVRENGEDIRADDISVSLQADLNAHAVLLAKIDKKDSINIEDVSVSSFMFNSAPESAPTVMSMSAKMAEPTEGIALSRMSSLENEESKNKNSNNISLARILETKVLEKSALITVKSEDVIKKENKAEYEQRKDDVKKYIQRTKEKIIESSKTSDENESLDGDIDYSSDQDSWEKEIIEYSSVSLDEAVESLKSAEEHEKNGDKNRAYEDLRRSERATGKAEKLFTTGLKIEKENKKGSTKKNLKEIDKNDDNDEYRSDNDDNRGKRGDE